MTRGFGIIVHEQLPPSLRLVLDGYTFQIMDQAFLVARSVGHVSNFVELDLLKNDKSHNSRKTLIPNIYILAIVELKEGQLSPGFLSDLD